MLVSWFLEPSQPQRITSGLKTNFHIKKFHTTILKTLHTNSTLTHFIFCKTHHSLAGDQKLFPESRFERVNTKISLQNFFVCNLQQITTLNQHMFNCDYSITCNTNRSLFFSQNKGICQIRVTNTSAIQNSVFFPCITKR